MNLRQLAKENMSADWYEELSHQFELDYMKQLCEFLTQEQTLHQILPMDSELFNCFRYTPLSKVRIVLIGQDPYPNSAHAHGLCFSVRGGVFPYPRSLVNMFRELQSDLGIAAGSGCLRAWAERGMLLLNSCMTVREGASLSHQKAGWIRFTDEAISIINRVHSGIVFVLLGNFARGKAALIDKDKHFIVEAPHPSPLSASRGFFGSRIFSRVNNCLTALGRQEFDFSL